MTESAENGSGKGDLTKKIIRQVEFYFGDYNLLRDKFMRDKIREDDGWFTMEIMLKFKRLSSLCSEPTTILEALKTSDHGLMEVDMENQRIRRKPSRQVPEDNEEYRTQLKARTVYVNGFQEEENIEAITDFLAEYGQIDGVSLQRTYEKKFKGSVFATFATKEDAAKFIQAPMVYYKCNELTKMLRSEYYKQQEAEKKGAKKKKKDEEHEKDDKDEFEGMFAVKVSGIDDDTILHMDIKRVFETHGVQSIRFFDRIAKLSSDGYLIFQDDRTAEDVLKILDEKEGGRKITIKSAQVEFSVPTEEEAKLFKQSFAEARQRMFGGRGKKGKYNQHKNQRGKKRTPKKQGKMTTFGSDDENQGGGDGQNADEVEPPAKQAKTE